MHVELAGRAMPGIAQGRADGVGFAALGGTTHSCALCNPGGGCRRRFGKLQHAYHGRRRALTLDDKLFPTLDGGTVHIHPMAFHSCSRNIRPLLHLRRHPDTVCQRASSMPARRTCMSATCNSSSSAGPATQQRNDTRLNHDDRMYGFTKGKRVMLEGHSEESYSSS
jgi:hypothetical protein